MTRKKAIDGEMRIGEICTDGSLGVLGETALMVRGYCVAVVLPGGCSGDGDPVPELTRAHAEKLCADWNGAVNLQRENERLAAENNELTGKWILVSRDNERLRAALKRAHAALTNAAHENSGYYAKARDTARAALEKP